MRVSPGGADVGYCAPGSESSGATGCRSGGGCIDGGCIGGGCIEGSEPIGSEPIGSEPIGIEPIAAAAAAALARCSSSGVYIGGKGCAWSCQPPPAIPPSRPAIVVVVVYDGAEVDGSDVIVANARMRFADSS